VRALWDLLVALRGSAAIALRRSSRARVAAVALAASLALGGHLAVSRVGGETEPGVASPPGAPGAAGPEGGPAGGGPLTASLTAAGGDATPATGDDAADDSGASGPGAGSAARSTAVTGDGPVGDGPTGAADGAVSTTTTPAASTTAPPTSAPLDPVATTTVPDGRGGSPGLIEGLLDLLDL
jgi:hypothetical protein